MSFPENQSKSRGEIINGMRSDAPAVAAAALLAGQIVAIPTDTVYGLAAAIGRPKAIARLFALKGRPRNKAIPVLLSDVSQIGQVGSRIPGAAAILATHFWPGALTLVIPARADLPAGITSSMRDGMQTVAVRVPNHALARAVIARAGGAIAVTSANRSNEPACRTAEEVFALGKPTPDMIVDDGPASGGVESTIVAVIGASPVLLRAGAIPMERIVQALGAGLHAEEVIVQAV